ncbi:hypothetical protein NDU88_004024 [Pleurodeles waltl]|uniref:Uncharacterized protein n=1 Tax=Pleurodeles waltl TaxID=8319 RepID=A0AAV7MXC6_PLEWA|nr:hypothetical protein NDU88_004024 [Pleurodeles waltl]
MEESLKLAEELFRNLDSGSTVHQATVNVNRKNKEGLRDKFIKLEKLRKNEMSRWWDAITLKQYKKLNRIPRGLRSHIFPTYDDLDIDLLMKWEEELKSNSMKLMDILIENAERKVAKLQSEIEELEKEIKDLNLKEATEKNFAILNDIISKFQDEIKQRKARKFKRDELDYINGMED